MNILFLANELRYTCGVTNHLINLTKGLSEIKGNNLWIICGGGNGLDRFKNTEIIVVKNRRFFHEERNFSSYMTAIAFLGKFIIRNKINIVHSHSHYTANIARNAARITRTPTLQTNHGLLENAGRLKHFNAGKYIAVNEHIYDFLVRNKISVKSDIRLIRCGIPIPETIPEKAGSKLKVVAASRFSHEKGLDVYVEAVSNLSSEIKSKAEFLCAGDGELRTVLLKMNKEAGSNISFVGNVKDIYKLLRNCHILVYPSRSRSEGFPAIITEAGANGLVVITSNFPGADSVIFNNQDGIIFQMESASDLATKLSNVINKFENHIPLALNLYKKIREWFTIEEMIIKHQNLYEQCLKQ